MFCVARGECRGLLFVTWGIDILNIQKKACLCASILFTFNMPPPAIVCCLVRVPNESICQGNQGYDLTFSPKKSDRKKEATVAKILENHHDVSLWKSFCQGLFGLWHFSLLIYRYKTHESGIKQEGKLSNVKMEMSLNVLLHFFSRWYLFRLPANPETGKNRARKLVGRVSAGRPLCVSPLPARVCFFPGKAF